MSEAENYKPIKAHDKEENYRHFKMAHGFDIRETRGMGPVGRSTVSDTRDKRDPQAVGRFLLTRPQNVSILEMADVLGEFT